MSVPNASHGQQLDVYLGAGLVGQLERRGPRRYRFTYTEEVAAAHAGAPFLSVGLPVRAGTYANREAKAFFEGLLPEQDVRRAVARELQIHDQDGFGLLERIGADCAGAVVVLPAGAGLPDSSTASVRWLDEDELAQKIINLPRAPLGIVPGRVRLSLAGLQQKLLVTRASSGRIGEPLDGAPSTHIIKPAQGEFDGLVANEAFGLRVARCAGFEVANAWIDSFGGIECLVVERFDRSFEDDGVRIRRLHQEDFCQALGRPPDRKYEFEGGPTLVESFELLRNVAGPRAAADIIRLLDAVLLNFVLGNSDAHGKNFGLLYEDDGAPRLAPLYDLVSTRVYDVVPDMAMSLGGTVNPGEVDLARWRELAADARLGRAAIIARIRRRVPRISDCCDAVEALAQAEGWHHAIISDIVRGARARAAQLV